jgi:hypothetical protein
MSLPILTSSVRPGIEKHLRRRTLGLHGSIPSVGDFDTYFGSRCFMRWPRGNDPIWVPTVVRLFFCFFLTCLLLVPPLRRFSKGKPAHGAGRPSEVPSVAILGTGTDLVLKMIAQMRAMAEN